MRRVATGAALVVALALPATAIADGKIKLKGDVVGVPASSVKITVTKKSGHIGKITKLSFKRVPLACEDGVPGASVGGRTTRSFAVRGKDFTRRTRLEGPGIKKGFFRVAGKFRRGGKTAKGSVRFALKRTDGVGCGTGDVRWKAAK